MEEIGKYLKVINDNIISFMFVILMFTTIIYGIITLFKILIKKLKH